MPGEAEGGRPIRLDDRLLIEAAFAEETEAASERTFANLFLFRARHGYRILDEPVAHVRGLTYDGRVHALPLAPADAAAMRALFAAGVECIFPLAHEDARRLEETGGFARSANVADDDYIFDGGAIARLDGAKMRRAQARRFGDEARPDWLPWTSGLAADATDVLDGWLADVGGRPDHADVAECREAIAFAGDIGLEGGIVRDGDGRPLGMLLASRRADGERIVHFAKGRRRAEGVYPWMFAEYARTSGATRLNFEQDLANPGLARSKRAYRPAMLRRKWRLSAKATSSVTQL